MSKDIRFLKPKRAIDHLPENPSKALEEVWYLEDVAQLIHGELTYWFYMALSHGGTIYNDDDTEIRAAFIQFYADLLPLIEATFCYNVRSVFYNQKRKFPDRAEMTQAIKDTLTYDYYCVYLTSEEEMDPYLVFTRFCVKHPIDYVRRELLDFVDAVSFYQGPFRKRVSKHAYTHYYLKILTMVEAGYAFMQYSRQ